MDTMNVKIGREILETLTSSLYEDPIIIFREYVQNSLDAYNNSTDTDPTLRFWDFKVDITIDSDNRNITVKDNGYGIQTDFLSKMLTIGDSSKTDKKDFIGFRGIGRLSGLPFCTKLKFTNKVKGKNTIDTCIWDGSGYRDLLSNKKNNESLIQTVTRITTINEEVYKGDSSDHFFEVKLETYSDDLKDVIDNKSFNSNISKLLPLKYSEEFSSHRIIEEEFQRVMGKPLSRYICPVYLNRDELIKQYTDSENLLSSNIRFWTIMGTKKDSDEKKNIGLLWFTFNKKITAFKSNDQQYGILIRSKNILMGNNDTFADLCRNVVNYIAPHRELTQTLRGVYGEMLIDTDTLSDNARRDWFKPDRYSRELKYVIVDFMEKLYKYRYAGSKFLNLKTSNEQDPKYVKSYKTFKDAFTNLLQVTNDDDIQNFCARETDSSNNNKEESEELSFSAQDMPTESITKRRIYDELMELISAFCEKEDLVEKFLKLRAYIKNKYHKEE